MRSFLNSVLLVAGVALGSLLDRQPDDDSFCANINDVVISAEAGLAATAYCSSILSISLRTSTVTSTAVVVSTRTDIYTTSTRTVTNIVGPVAPDAPDPTVTVTVYGNSSTFTVSKTPAVFPSAYYSCLSGDAAIARSQAQKRISQTLVPKPGCLEPYPLGSAISSACDCLSVPSATLTEATRTITSQSIYFSTINVIITTTIVVPPPDRSIVIEEHTIPNVKMQTVTNPVAAPTHFALQMANDHSHARVDMDHQLSFHPGYTGPESDIPSIFTLDVDTCALISIAGVPYGTENYIAMQATNAGSDIVRFESPTLIDAGYLPLMCEITRGNHTLKCVAGDGSPHGGVLGTANQWRVPITLSSDGGAGTLVLTAVPIPYQRHCFALCESQGGMRLPSANDLFPGQTVLQDCLKKCGGE